MYAVSLLVLEAECEKVGGGRGLWAGLGWRAGGWGGRLLYLV